MALSKDQQFSQIIFFLLRNGEDFRILYKGEEWYNIGNNVYCCGVCVDWARADND